MNELRNSKSDDQLEELLLLTEQMQEELDQKDRTIRELKMQLDESLTLNERLNSENRAGNIQALKNDLRKTKELLQSEKEKTHAAEIMTEECQDKLRQAEQERDYALSHQKKVEIPVEKPVLYQKCGNCNLTAYLKAKEKYDTQREKLAGRYKTKTAMYEALMFLLIWYSVSTTLFQMIRSKIFISDCVVFFDTIATFIQTIAGWIILTGKNMAQISNGISNPVVAGIVYWLIRILICGGCLVGAGILVAFIEIKIAELYKKCCWDMITIREIKYKFNLMLEDRTIEVWAYNLETVLAEKLETVVSRNVTNTRMRDFYDIYILQKLYGEQLQKQVLWTALVATAKKRGTLDLIEAEDIREIFDEIESSPVMETLWKTYQKNYSYAADISWHAIVKSICALYGSILENMYDT